MFLVAYLQVLEVVIAILTVFVLQVPRDLPDIIANTKASIEMLCAALHKTMEVHRIFGKRAPHKFFLCLDLVHWN